MKINDTERLFRILSPGVSQESILGPISFNICTDDLMFFINEAKLSNFADDNAISAARNDLNELLSLLKKESEVAIKWFSDNNMIVNPKIFKTINVNRQNRSNHNCCLTINNAEIKSKKSVTLLGTEIYNKLNFGKHVSTISKKANNQLNAVIRCTSRTKEKEILINTFVYSNFIYEPLIWNFTTRKRIKEVEKCSRKKSQAYIK